MVVGITGGIGSGKSTAINFFKKFSNIATYTADKEAKQLMNSSLEIKKNICTQFGKEAYKNNQLNKLFLANIVFNNAKKLAILNAIVHPVVYKHLNEFIKRNKQKDYILYENAILFENKSDTLCNKIITVFAPEDLRIQRVMQRDSSNESEIKNRINNQWNDTKKIIQSHYIINNINLSDTKQQVAIIHEKIINTQYLI